MGAYYWLNRNGYPAVKSAEEQTLDFGVTTVTVSVSNHLDFFSPLSQNFNLHRIPTADGNSKAVHAVGAANGRNPVAIIVPCHRIFDCGGHPKLTGHGGCLWRTEWLLRHGASTFAPDD